MLSLSIITINYNNAAGLEKTIKSVINQSFKDFEYIIIDGGSTDGSKELIEKYAESITYWVSEKDNGIYPAMNKGIHVSNGEYILFLNSGDWLCNNASIYNLMCDSGNIDIIYGDWYLSYTDGRIIEEKFPDLLTFYFMAFWYSIPHQASLIKRSLFYKIGLYDENLKFVSDWKFFMQAIFIHQCSYMHKNTFVVFYDKEGFSGKTENNTSLQEERRIIVESYFSNFLYLKKDKEDKDQLLFQLQRCQRKLPEKILSKMKAFKKQLFSYKNKLE